MSYRTVKNMKESSLKKYEEKKASIQKLLRQIEAGLDVHDKKASLEGGHHWGHVGDLNRIESELKELKDILHGMGEYQFN